MSETISVDIALDKECPEPLLVSLSPMLRICFAIRENARRVLIAEAKGALSAILEAEGVADSLKEDAAKGAVRQLDIRPEKNGPIVLKTFTQWNQDRQCWLVLMEYGIERHWDKHLYANPINN